MTLFEHNRTAYEAALSLLRRTGKAAVIHPTGTGKSFIAFHLCEEHPESRVCFLSPSEYIVWTQLENWMKAGGKLPENMVFFTYAKLLLMEAEELACLQPDFIVLDEFHRCGARMWGQGVANLLQTYPQVPVLGLSATNVRYLDNRRDMAKELFDGNIASEMSIGEAIVRGILTPPKYVLSLYSRKRALARYEASVRGAKNKAVQMEAELQLEELKRALEQADGVEEIFRKHLPDPHGKYLLFCTNFEHMQKMKKKVPEWFGFADTQPNLYTVYSEDAEAQKEFAAFKADESEHLKLLFCIDMLNEGIHVEDVSGVILLRPTISPIVYKQQIGRALSVGKKKNAVIFDIVLNIESLYSIGAIEEEMQLAVNFYRSHGQEEKVVQEQFWIVDEVRDCRRLFRRLNDTLNASWNLMYRMAEQYYRENGDLEVPKRYVTEKGYTLGAWLATQRRIYANKTSGSLTDEQIEKLDAIGMRWQGAREAAWEKFYAAAKAYYREQGDLLVSVNENNYHGVALGKWIAGLRVYKKSGEGCVYLTPERMVALEAIGMVWDVPDYYWEQNYRAAKDYFEAHGSLQMPHDYVDENGIRLGAWLAKQRAAKAKQQGAGNDADTPETGLTKEQIAKLDALGMQWSTRHDIVWLQNFEEACRYKEKYKNLEVPVAYVTENGCRLGKWIRHQRDAYKAGTLSAERTEKLESVGLVLAPEDAWESKFNLARSYYEEHGNLNMKSNYVVEGVWLARWLGEQTARMNGRITSRSKTAKKLTPVQIGMLESIGVGRG